MEFEKHPNPTRKPAEECREIAANIRGFGKIFTDHMVTGTYTSQNGWHGFQVGPVENFSFHPGSAILHYGQSIFEGLKAYQQQDGSVAAFRPELNARRFALSAERLAMAPLPEDIFLASLRALVEADRDWVPPNYGTSLYLRPMMIALDQGLMTNPSDSYRYVLIASPVGDYFPNGVKPVTVWISPDYVRAVRGGVGEAKCGGNYAAGFIAQREAMANGCDQVVYLDAIDRQGIEEMGGMNIYFVFQSPSGKAKIVTPSTSGSILRGVTRHSLLTLARDLGYEAEERRITYEEWRAGCASGAITECFACGTAAVITPIGHVKSKQEGFTVADGGTGAVTAELRKALLDIQHGRSEDRHGWRYHLA